MPNPADVVEAMLFASDVPLEAERIRDVTQGPEGALYLLTDDPQGRVLKLVPKK